MPITLNHSNINVQYSSDKSYIIETVKSDLYRRNEIVDTIIRNNIQTAPVTPTTYVDSSGNVYAVESYTYSGTANTADYTRVFTKNTTCDILIVGGGGAGGTYIGGGGGAGGVLHITNATIPVGTYNIQVGKGGDGVIGGASGTVAQNGSSSKAFGIEVFGGGYGGVGSWGTSGVTQNGANGGSGGGGGSASSGTAGTGGTVTQPSFTSSVITVNNYTYYGGNGASGITFNNNSFGSVGANGGGGAGGNAPSNTDQYNAGAGADGIAINITGTSYFWGGGGGGGQYGGTYNGKAGNGGKGGGGGGSGSQVADQVGLGGIGGITLGQDGDLEGDGTPTAGNGGSGTGGGGGGCGRTTVSPNAVSGSGGSGIVIIRYLLGTIPTINYLTNEPVITAPTFTESIRTFTHSGGTEAQTTYDITIPQNTICDILMIGGGGGGGKDRAGGGGAGALILSIGNILSGTYNIRVGNKGLGATTAANGQNGYDCEIYKSDGTIIFRAKGGGGGQSLNAVNVSDGGCGGGKSSQFTGLGGIAVSTNVVNGITTGPVITTTYGVYGNVGGRNTTPYVSPNLNNLDGAGGGGIGEGGSTSGTTLVPVDNQFVVNNGGKGGDGLYFATINGTTYNFKNYFNVNGVQDGTTGNFFIGGGGGGGDYGVGSSGASGKGGGGVGGEQTTTGANATGFGSGGGGGGGDNYNGGNGSAGIIVIKLRTIINAAIPEGNPITHKTLNFTFNQDNIVAYYKFNNSSSLGIDSNPSSTKYNLTPTIVGGTGGYNTTIAVEGASFQATNDGDYLEGSFPIRSIYDNSTTGISVSCWFYRKSGTTYDNPYATTLFVFYTNPSDKEFSVSLAHYNNVYTINWATTYVAYGNETYCSGFGPAQTLDTWYHLVISLNKSGIFKAYLNGVNLNLSNTSGTPRINTSGSSAYPLPEFPNVSKLKIFNPSSSGSKFSGNIDEFYVFNKEISQDEITSLYNKTFSIPINQYTLNFPVPTLTGINNNSNIVLNGAYDISLNTSNALIIPKNNQYIPKSMIFTNYSVERMYPPVRNFTAATTIVSGQTYGNGTYVVSFSSTYGSSIDPWTCFNTSTTSGGHWPEGRYTAGVFNSTSFIVEGYLGDWLKIQLPVAIKLTRFSFLQRTTNLNRAPKDFKIYGSNDNITWVELVNKTDAVYNASYIYEQTTPEITTAYTYYGLVVNKLSGADIVLNFDEWYIYGQEPLTDSLSLRYSLLNPILDPVGAQWTYSSNNTNVYNIGSVGIGTSNPQYSLDINGTLNAKEYFYNGVQIGRLSEGMVANVQHLTYTHMEVKNNTGWDAINDDLATGFVISITPKSNLSKILVNLVAHIGLTNANDGRWWGFKLYRKIGTAGWAEVTGPNGTETGASANTAGTPVWISNNMGTVGTYNERIINLTGTYLDSPNTTSIVYYTAYWNQRMGDNPSRTGELWLNRAGTQNDAWRPAPSSSWTLKEIWYG